MDINTQLGVYPDIEDPDFYKIISQKKEFYDNNINNRNKDIYCLEPQQRLLSNFINPLTQYNSILIYHSVGVGKTLSAISIAENFKDNYNIMVLVKNKSLELNFKKELLGVCSNYISTEERSFVFNNVKKENDKELQQSILKNANKMINKHYKFITYGSIVNSVLGKKIPELFDKNVREVTTELNNINNTVLIIDEVHNITGNDTYKAVKKLLDNSKNFKIILLSATPIYDNIKEVFEIANLLGDNLPIGQSSLLKSKYIAETISSNKNKILKDNLSYLTDKGIKTIIKSLKGKISYLITDPEFFPTRTNIGTPIFKKQGSIKIFRCLMSDFQTYSYIKTLDHNKNINNTLFKNSSDASTIVYPDSSYGKDGFIKNITKNKNKNFLKKDNIKEYSCKLYNILNNIEKSKGSCFIYSNFVNYGGTHLIIETLYANGYSSYGTNNNKPKFILLDDSVNSFKRQKLVREFNHNKNSYGNHIKIIIGSPVVSEGITFKNIRQIHILEPYWNMSRIEQIIGRGVRFKSHQYLPLKDRTTDIFLYTSIPSNPNYNSIDLLKYELSEEKDRIIKKIERHLKSTAMDCILNKKRNKLSNEFNNTRQCEYIACDYSCPSENSMSEKNIDVSTYNLTNHDKSKYNFILNSIKKLYKIGHLYDIEHIIEFVKKQSSTTIDTKNIYYVLNDIIDKNLTLKNPLNIDCTLIDFGEYYIVNPEDKPINEQFFYKIFTKYFKYNNLNKFFDITKKISKPKKSLKIIDEKKLVHPIYGSYINKTGTNDGKFRIIDNRSQDKLSKDKRKIITGKACNSYSKTDLVHLISDLKIKNIENNMSKIDYCSIIENFLNNNNLIL